MNNWWGWVEGPGATGCDDSTFFTGIAGFLDADPWLVLLLNVDPASLPVSGSAQADALLVFNSDGGDTLADGHLPDGTPVSFDSTGGTMAPPEQGSDLGQATSFYTAGLVPGDFLVTATVDFATVSSPVRVTGEAALAMAIAPTLQIRDDGETAELTISISNAGPDPATSVGVAVDFPAELSGVGWICVGSGGGTCSNEGSGDIGDVAGLPVGSAVAYTAIGAVPDPFVGVLSVEGLANPPDFIIDSDPSDNAATAEIRSFRIFGDGFESGDTSAWSVTVP